MEINEETIDNEEGRRDLLDGYGQLDGRDVCRQVC